MILCVKGPQVFYYETSSEGKELAADLQESLNTTLEVERPREIKGNTSYYLLKRSKGVLVIAECGFLTNPDEADLLQTGDYQKKVAAALADGICHIFTKTNESSFAIDLIFCYTDKCEKSINSYDRSTIPEEK